MTALVVETDYRRWSGDSGPSATAWSDVGPFLDDALSDIEEYLNRKLTQASYTESLKLYYNAPSVMQWLGWFVYPSAIPVLTVTDPPNGQVFGEDLLIGVTPAGFMGEWIFGGGYPDYTMVTYTGGFTQATLPKSLGRAIAQVAYRRLFPDKGLVRIPDHTIQVQTGDLRLQFPRLTGFQGAPGRLDRATRLAIRGWRRVEV